MNKSMDDTTASAGRVLVVEDEDASREALAEYLGQCGYQVESVGTAAAAMALSLRWRPDVLVSDWQLGGRLTGVDIARTLQQRYGLAVVLVTGKPLAHLRALCHDIDVSGYFRKPVSLASLARLIDSGVYGNA
jgi:CheY-like chemotaxis protein